MAKRLGRWCGCGIGEICAGGPAIPTNMSGTFQRNGWKKPFERAPRRGGPMDTRQFPTTTHEVINQSGPLLGVNVFDGDIVLRETVAREGAGWIRDRASRLGAAAGEAQWQQHA